MQTRVRTAAATVTLAALLLSAPLFAGESAEEDLRQCRRLVELEKWGDAAVAYLALFEDHPRDRLLLAEMRAIEDDLKRALFMGSYREPRPADLFGGKVKRFGESSLKLVVVFEDAAKGPRWIKAPGDLDVLDLRFRDKLSIEMETTTHDPEGHGIGILFCYDIEQRGGYLVGLGARWEENHRSYRIPRFVERLDAGERTRLFEEEYPEAPSPGRYKIVREQRTIRLLIQNRHVNTISDGTYKGGYLAFTGHFPDKVTITGSLEKGFYNQLVGGLRDQAFREWQDKEYDREKLLPAWARDPVASVGAGQITELPSDTPPDDRESILTHVEGCLEGREKSVVALTRLAKRQEGATKSYLVALTQIGRGRIKAAEESLERLLEEEAGFAPGLALRGLLRLQLRRIDEARKDLEAARKASPTLALAWLGEVQLAIYDGDLERALAILDRARDAGARCTELADMPALLHRAQKGPLWSERHGIDTTHFTLMSDHSKDLCRDTAHVLEAALRSYAKQFPEIEIPDRKARVYVFAGRDGYLGYAEDRQRNLAHSSGMYDPSLRELLVYLPEDRSTFVHTIRHEGFHRFLHEHLEKAPLWFNEGMAEYFASAREAFGGELVPGAPYREALDFLGSRMKHLTPLEELFRMDPRTYMQKAGIHYPQSWAVVHCLMNTREPALKGVLMAYFKSLREGLSIDEAYEKHFEPVIDLLENSYRSHIREMLAE